jgi:hypothetical protein
LRVIVKALPIKKEKEEDEACRVEKHDKIQTGV